jgi:hypothetical protein
MTVNSQHFVTAMTESWTSNGNATSLALKDCWQQMAETFNQQICGSPTANGWNILPLPTGAGKTTGLALYCSMLPKAKHPGVLIVTRFKAGADELADRINERSPGTALSYHTDRPADDQALAAIPVLIITHKAYELVLEQEFARMRFLSWSGGLRKLTVIDEALSIIKYTQITLDGLRHLAGSLPIAVTKEYPHEIAIVNHVIDTLKTLALEGGLKHHSCCFQQSDWGFASQVNFSKLRGRLKSLAFDELVLQKHDNAENAHLRTIFDETLADLQEILHSWSWYATKGKYFTLSTARVILDTALMNAVVLDATAHLNPVYRLFEKQIRLIAVPPGTRSYENVMLHASVGHRVGKTSLTKNIKAEADKFMSSLVDHVGKGHKLLLCTHKNLASHFEGYDQHFAEYDVATWGAIDGKNDWQHYDNIAICGLQFLDNISPHITLKAIEQWRGSSFGEETRKQLVDDLYIGHVTVSLVQAINRIHCRRPVDEKGNCSKTRVYLLLPGEAHAKTLVQGIMEAMPQIKAEPWASSVARRKVKRSKYETVLVACLRSLGRGNYAVRELRNTLSIPKRALEKVISKLKSESSTLSMELSGLSVRYCVEGIGRGAKSYFVKA